MSSPPRLPNTTRSQRVESKNSIHVNVFRIGMRRSGTDREEKRKMYIKYWIYWCICIFSFASGNVQLPGCASAGNLKAWDNDGTGSAEPANNNDDRTLAQLSLTESLFLVFYSLFLSPTSSSLEILETKRQNQNRLTFGARDQGQEPQLICRCSHHTFLDNVPLDPQVSPPNPTICINSPYFHPRQFLPEFPIQITTYPISNPKLKSKEEP